MRVKIGQGYFDSSVEPIMLVLDSSEKRLIARMAPTSTKFCSFPETMSEEDAAAFMADD